MINIGYFADGPWSHLALKKIIENKRFKIKFIVPRYDTQDPVLKEWSRKLKVDFLPIENVNNSESIKVLQSYKADIFVSLSFNQILKKEIINAAPYGFINCHAGALPYYRGRNILNWALINNENKFGVTAHFIDEGIDTGDIIIQKFCPITDEDTYATLLEMAIKKCADVLYEALLCFQEDRIIRKSQSKIHPHGFYCGRRKEGDEWVDWSLSSRRIFDFVRAISYPGPCAQTICGGQIFKIIEAKLIVESVNYIGTPGEIVGYQGESLIVKTRDSVILVTCIDPMPKKPWIGVRFGWNLIDIVQQLAQRVNALELVVDKK